MLSSFRRQLAKKMQDQGTPDLSSATRAQCWECRRRRLVCDGDKPVCLKCRTAGIVCPGYADKKPLVWVANGQVLSRPRGRKPKDKAEMMRSVRPVATQEVGPTELVQAGASAGVVPGLLPPLRRDTRLRTDQCDMLEAVNYCKFPKAGPQPRPPCLAYLWTPADNTRLYDEAMEDQLIANSYVIKWPNNVASLPPSVAHLMVSTTISHRLLRLSGDIYGDHRMSWARSRLYHHRVIAIRLISELVMDERNPASDMAIVGVWSLFSSQVSSNCTASGIVRGRGTDRATIPDPAATLSILAAARRGLATSDQSPRFHDTLPPPRSLRVTWDIGPAVVSSPRPFRTSKMSDSGPPQHVLPCRHHQPTLRPDSPSSL